MSASRIVESRWAITKEVDQPAVELGKHLANARLGKPGFEADKEALDQFLKKPEEKQDF